MLHLHIPGQKRTDLHGIRLGNAHAIVPQRSRECTPEPPSASLADAHQDRPADAGWGSAPTGPSPTGRHYEPLMPVRVVPSKKERCVQ